MTNRALGFEQPPETATWHAPTDVVVQEGCLVVPSTNQTWREVQTERDMLDEFVHLADASAAQIADYASSHGLLYVCDRHLLPSSHQIWSVGGPGPLAFPQCHPMAPHRMEVYVTPLSVWRYWSRAARAILRIASRLDQDRPGDPNDWRAISEEGLDEWRQEIRQHLLSSPFLRGAMTEIAIPMGVSYGESLTWSSRMWRQELTLPEPLGKSDIRRATMVEAERLNLAVAMSTWLRMAGVLLHLEWSGKRPEVSLAGAPLFGALGIQLMLALTRADGLVVCMSCGEPYVPGRRPSRGRRNYCRNCGRRAAIRDAAREFRKRRRGD